MNSLKLKQKLASKLPKIDINVTDPTRKLPMSECGLVMIYTVGVQGLSPQQAEKEIATCIENNTDLPDNYMGQHFKFLKEIWLTSCETNETKVEVKII